MPVLVRTQRMKHTDRWWQSGYFRMDEQESAVTDLVPVADSLHFYAKDKAGVSALYWRDDAGVEHEVATGATVITDHGGLTGLGDDDHSIYLLAAGTRALTGDWTTGAFNINIGGGAAANELRFLEPSGSGTNYTGFKAQAQAASVTYTLPAADATVSGYALTSDAAGTLSWGAAGVSDHGALTGLVPDDDHTQYALLAGRSGGQVLIGGTGVADDLILRSTSGVGSDFVNDIVFQTGNNGSVEQLRMMQNTTTPLWRIPKEFLWQVQNVTSSGYTRLLQYTGGSVIFEAEVGFQVSVGGVSSIFGDGGGLSTTTGSLTVSRTTTGACQLSFTGHDAFAQIINNSSVNLYITNGGATGDLVFRTASSTARAFITAQGNLTIGAAANNPTTGDTGIVFADGTALATMAANTAGIYADDIAGNVSMHAINENGDVIKLIKTGTYTPTNVGADRSYDADSTTVDELADVLGTLIADLQLTGLLG